MDRMPINSYPDEVARRWKAERDRYREALEAIAGVHDPRRRGGTHSVEARISQAAVYEQIARDALSKQECPCSNGDCVDCHARRDREAAANQVCAAPPGLTKEMLKNYKPDPANFGEPWHRCACGAMFHLKDSPKGICPNCRDNQSEHQDSDDKCFDCTEDDECPKHAGGEHAHQSCGGKDGA